MGKIPADYLPPSELRPQRIYTLPEFKDIPQRLNSTEELLGKIGAVVLPTSVLFSRSEIAHVFNNAEVKAVIVAATLLEELEKAIPDLKTVKHIIVVGGEAEEIKKKGYLLYQELLDSGEPTCDPVRRDRMDVSVLLFTSGTPGLPKGPAHFMEAALIVPH